MVTAKGKKRYNLHLSEEHTEIVREFIQKHKMTLSGYVELLFVQVAQNIKDEGLEYVNGPIEIRKLFEVLKIDEYLQDHSDQALLQLMEDDPRLVVELMKKNKLFLSDRYYKKTKKEK